MFSSFGSRFFVIQFDEIEDRDEIRGVNIRQKIRIDGECESNVMLTRIKKEYINIFYNYKFALKYYNKKQQYRVNYSTNSLSLYIKIYIKY